VYDSDWVKNKVQSKFVFEGMCWARSHIPKSIWQAGDSTSNVVESVHANVNRDGISCTLVGGIKKGQYFDAVKMATLIVCRIHFITLLLTPFFQEFETTGVRPSYRSGHPYENATKNLKRKGIRNFHFHNLPFQLEFYRPFPSQISYG
jgi:hypothetical protein